MTTDASAVRVREIVERDPVLDRAMGRAILDALKRAKDEPWAADAPWIMAFKEWVLEHGVDDPSGAMLWAELHIGTILHAVNNFTTHGDAIRAAAVRETREAIRELADRAHEALTLNELVQELRAFADALLPDAPAPTRGEE